LNARWMRVLADTTKLELVVLPRIARGVRGPDELALLANALVAPPREPSS
jgi:hypothetical protein